MELPDGAPFELAPGLTLRKATPQEVAAIRHTLITYAVSPLGFSPLVSYETQRHDVPNGDNSISTSFTPLSEPEWRYNVVTNDGGQNDIYLAHLASNVTAIPLEISSIKFCGNRISQWSLGRVARHFGTYTGRKTIAPSQADIEQLAQVLEAVRPHLFAMSDSPFPDIQRAFLMYDSLGFLMDNSEFNVIGLFAIIEMLITHNPKLEDRGDSITHQMQAKLPLLIRRFQASINHEDFFGKVDSKKVWSALYAFRSSIAHGGVADFSKGAMHVLGSADLATEFVRTVVKGLLRQLLVEPQLFQDLKNC
jgi:hypothetical protein